MAVVTKSPPTTKILSGGPPIVRNCSSDLKDKYKVEPLKKGVSTPFEGGGFTDSTEN